MNELKLVPSMSCANIYANNKYVSYHRCKPKSKMISKSLYYKRYSCSHKSIHVCFIVLIHFCFKLTDTTLDQLIALSNVLSFKSKSQHGRFSQCQVTTYDTRSPELWNWNILTSLGRHLAVTRCTFSWESKSHMKYV